MSRVGGDGTSVGAVTRLLTIAGFGLLLTAPVCEDAGPPAFAYGECDQGDERCCGDNVDNDGDSHIDCADKDCINVGPCANVEGNCSDTVDNDMDGVTDCADPDCASACSTSGDEICDNGLDDDADNDFDCGDAECASSAWCGAEANCADLQDNDADGASDCADPGCVQKPACFGEVICDDNIDNDMDGQNEFIEPACQWTVDNLFCPTGLNLYVFRSAVALAIPDGTTVTKTIKIPMTGRLFQNMAVHLFITHPVANDLDISLTRPGGTPQDISSDNPVSVGANYSDTEFRDDIGTPVMSSSAPFSGPHKPEVAFSTYAYGNNRTLNGDWVLTLTDDTFNTSSGNLTIVDLAFCVDP